MMSELSKEIILDEICQLEHMINLLYLKHKMGQCSFEEYARGRAECYNKMPPLVDSYMDFLISETEFPGISEPLGPFAMLFYYGYGWV